MKIDIDLDNEREEKRDVAKRVTERMKEYKNPIRQATQKIDTL